ncbi:alpha/beta hydrolase [Ramlibacter henchirensis]|uniref:Alpha/beta hydrolase n=1 Tax=Ramlibacter henchirensis TaxID=204072 RepID=A0A4Z0BU31_9BURK|nr:alpha/beta hydrolase [Ramlibacter henchirensis]TFZ02252.1 alpha/beta hydrolase [Ramlibacter henchirensis]
MPTVSLRTAHQAPPLALLAMEPLRAMFDFAASRLAFAPAQQIGDGHPVVVFPGLGGAPFTTSHLRSFLSGCGFTAHCWGRGVNTGPEGDFDDWLDGLEADVRRWHAQSGRKVSLVGWSLGGIYARELAKRCPESVRQVITLGTPFASLRGSTHAETLYKFLHGDVAQLTPALDARLRECPPVPTTSVYSKTDGVVCWRGCIERKSALSESVEVEASHLGMATHPEVLRIVADRLAQPEGQWRPWRRKRLA